MSSHLPFKELLVIELSSVLAGPLAGSFFAEQGARVVKVEHPIHGDVTRSWKASGEDNNSDISAYYASANTSKEVVKIDLKSDGGRVWLEEILSKADILIQNFKEIDLSKFKLEPQDIASRFPNLIHLRLVGFKEESSRLAYDVVVQAETGFMHMNGNNDGPPTRMPVALMDVLASEQIRSAALTGLYSRSRGSKGIYSEVSLERSGLSALVNRATNYLMNGVEQNRLGSAHPNIAPYGDIIQTGNGRDLVLAVGNDIQFASLCRVLNCEQLITNPKYSSNIQRVNNRSRLLEELQARASNFNNHDELIEELTVNGVPAGVIRPLSEVFEKESAKNQLIDEGEVDGRKVLKPSVVAYSTTVFGK